MKTSKYYMARLQKYFDNYWGAYGDSAGWLTNPKPNQWVFIIEGLGLKVTLTCNDNGRVTEKRERVDIYA
jgi:hypothetical protein